MISTSHNAYSDNGIKFFAEGSVKLSDEIELKSKPKSTKRNENPASARLGRARRISGADDRYIEFCKSTFPSHSDAGGFEVGYRYANGAGTVSHPRCFTNWAHKSSASATNPSGYNINEKCGATYTKTLRQPFYSMEADYGIIDGDGDRLMMSIKTVRFTTATA